MTMDNDFIRPAHLAGSWYESEPEALRRSVEGYLCHAGDAMVPGTVVGLIAPHAGHIYSGPVAGHAYRTVRGQSFDTVIVVAPNHADPRLDFTAVMTRGGYRTPLGVVPIDEEAATAIVTYADRGTIRASSLGHLEGYAGRYEHSLEIQLPFLQVALGEFRLVPVIMGDRDRGEPSSKALGEAIARVVKGRRSLVVASTDLSHFHGSAELRRLDGVARDLIETYNPEGFLARVAAGDTEACGALPVAAVMMASRLLGADTATVLAMADSGDVTGDHSSAVGYLAAALTRPADSDGQCINVSRAGVDLGISGEDKAALRDVVIRTLESVVHGGPVPDFEYGGGLLDEPWGAFVTLTCNGQLRGCIGTIVGSQPLVRTVAGMARAAALEDPRFPPVTPGELASIEFEISVLTPIRRVTHLDEIVIGRDGLIVTKGWHRGLLLPQVATEYGWDRTTFLEHTCRKAGLPADAWKDGDTVIEMFSAQVFH